MTVAEKNKLGELGDPTIEMNANEKKAAHKLQNNIHITVEYSNIELLTVESQFLYGLSHKLHPDGPANPSDSFLDKSVSVSEKIKIIDKYFKEMKRKYHYIHYHGPRQIKDDDMGDNIRITITNSGTPVIVMISGEVVDVISQLHNMFENTPAVPYVLTMDHDYISIDKKKQIIAKFMRQTLNILITALGNNKFDNDVPPTGPKLTGHFTPSEILDYYKYNFLILEEYANAHNLETDILNKDTNPRKCGCSHHTKCEDVDTTTINNILKIIMLYNLNTYDIINDLKNFTEFRINIHIINIIYKILIFMYTHREYIKYDATYNAGTMTTVINNFIVGSLGSIYRTQLEYTYFNVKLLSRLEMDHEYTIVGNTRLPEGVFTAIELPISFNIVGKIKKQSIGINILYIDGLLDIIDYINAYFLLFKIYTDEPADGHESTMSDNSGGPYISIADILVDIYGSIPKIDKIQQFYDDLYKVYDADGSTADLEKGWLKFNHNMFNGFAVFYEYNFNNSELFGASFEIIYHRDTLYKSLKSDFSQLSTRTGGIIRPELLLHTQTNRDHKVAPGPHGTKHFNITKFIHGFIEHRRFTFNKLYTCLSTTSKKINREQRLFKQHTTKRRIPYPLLPRERRSSTVYASGKNNNAKNHFDNITTRMRKCGGPNCAIDPSSLPH
jgi:hypothetical protein